MPDSPKNYCNIHGQFQLATYAGNCPICHHYYPYLINNGIEVPIPQRLLILDIYLENFKFLCLFLGFLQVFRPDLVQITNFFWHYGVLYLALLFAILSRGLRHLSSYSYYLLGIVTSLTIVVFFYGIALTSSITVIFSVWFLVFVIPTIGVYTSPATRKLFKLSEQLKSKLLEKQPIIIHPFTQLLQSRDKNVNSISKWEVVEHYWKRLILVYIAFFVVLEFFRI